MNLFARVANESPIYTNYGGCPWVVRATLSSVCKGDLAVSLTRTGREAMPSLDFPPWLPSPYLLAVELGEPTRLGPFYPGGVNAGLTISKHLLKKLKWWSLIGCVAGERVGNVDESTKKEKDDNTLFTHTTTPVTHTNFISNLRESETTAAVTDCEHVVWRCPLLKKPFTGEG